MDAPYHVCSPLFPVPPIAVMRLALKYGGVQFDAGEHYVKQSFRNRYHVLTANGVKALTIPVQHTGGTAVPTARMKLSQEKPWLRDHLRTLHAAYGSSPYFIHYIDEVERILSTPAETIGTFFSQTFEKWCILLQCRPQYSVSEAYLEKEFEVDLRLKIKRPEQFPQEGLTDPYPQVFEDRHPFAGGLSVIDLLFNEGPASCTVLRA